ncbi:MAG: glycogen synthase GlgA [Armatimonadota bacterium]|nr:glycogen synthase GlgA [Armatimonadota bacterium]
MDEPPKVLFCTPEATPFAKTGGLADVCGSLPLALSRLGCEVRLVMPAYLGIPRSALRPVARVHIPLGDALYEGTVLEGALGNGEVPVYFVDAQFFHRPGLYGEEGKDYPDNLARFAFFCRAVLEFLKDLPWHPDLLHCHDWQTALIPVYLKTIYTELPCRTVLTIHNLAYQGVFPPEHFPLLGLPSSLFTVEGLEFWGKVNLLKGGILFADVLTTVSPTYAQEIQTEEFGCGLEGVLRKRSQDLFGILNGIDTTTWDPAVDPYLPQNYTIDDLRGKAVCKRVLQEELCLNVDEEAFLVGMVTRLVEQKGLDLVAAILGRLFSKGGQFALLGVGDPRYHDLFSDMARRYPGQMALRLAFDEGLAHRIEAGADCFLMPSRYEPSGLNQLYSLRYGTIPVARRTGGLADTVVDCTPETLANGMATGFVFDRYDPEALWEALERAMAAFQDKSLWRRLQEAGMRGDFSWERASRQYLQLYARVLKKEGGNL